MRSPGDWLRSSAIGACPLRRGGPGRGTGTDRGRSEPVPEPRHPSSHTFSERAQPGHRRPGRVGGAGRLRRGDQRDHGRDRGGHHGRVGRLRRIEGAGAGAAVTAVATTLADAAAPWMARVVFDQFKLMEPVRVRGGAAEGGLVVLAAAAGARRGRGRDARDGERVERARAEVDLEPVVAVTQLRVAEAVGLDVVDLARRRPRWPSSWPCRRRRSSSLRSRAAGATRCRP